MSGSERILIIASQSAFVEVLGNLIMSFFIVVAVVHIFLPLCRVLFI